MPFPWMAAAMGAQAIGSLLGARSNAQAQQDQARRQQQQANQSLGQNYQQSEQNDRQFAQNANMERSKYLDQRGVDAAALQRRINLNPLADQAAYGMRSMLGQSPAAFEPRDYTRGTMPGAGQATGGSAPMLAAQQEAMGRYTAGAGGMDPSALIAARDRLQSMAGVPAEYQNRTADQSRLAAEMQQLRVDAANAKTAQERINIQNRINQLQQSFGGQGAAPAVTQSNDAQQAQTDRENRQQTQRRIAQAVLLPRLGLGGLVLGNQLFRGR